jgi:rhodanese-related sulfurtransferase
LYIPVTAPALFAEKPWAASKSTIGEEKQYNWSLQNMPEEQFVNELSADLPFIPAYFPYNVDLNKKGAPAFEVSVAAVPIGKAVSSEEDTKELDKKYWVVDVRDDKKFKSGHLAHSINIMDGDKFETWLGSIIKPEETFYLAAETNDQLMKMIKRTASIGYEKQIKLGFVVNFAEERNPLLDLSHFRSNQEHYTIVDVRNPSEVEEKKIFPSIAIPLAQLRERIDEIPTDKPIAVHCAGGYRSAAASSLLASEVKEQTKVYDIGEAIREFDKEANSNNQNQARV